MDGEEFEDEKEEEIVESILDKVKLHLIQKIEDLNEDRDDKDVDKRGFWIDDKKRSFWLDNKKRDQIVQEKKRSW